MEFHQDSLVHLSPLLLSLSHFPLCPNSFSFFHQDPRYYSVDLERGPTGFGFSLRGGSEYNMGLYVLGLMEGGPASRSQKIQVDKRTEKSFLTRSVHTVTDLVLNTTWSTSLITVNSHGVIQHRIAWLTFVAGGVCSLIYSVNCSVRPVLWFQVSDQLVEINGDSTVGMTHSQAVEQIRKGGHRIHLVLKRGNGYVPDYGKEKGICVGFFSQLTDSFCSWDFDTLLWSQLVWRESLCSLPARWATFCSPFPNYALGFFFFVLSVFPFFCFISIGLPCGCHPPPSPFSLLLFLSLSVPQWSFPAYRSA